MNRTSALDKAAKIAALMASEQTYGNEAAAQNFAATMQRLMLDHELSEADVERHRLAGTKPVEAPIVEMEVHLWKLGVDTSSKRNAALENLAGIVGRAHLCRLLVRSRSNTIWFVGTQAHIDVAEFMLATLWRSLQGLASTSRRAAKREGVDVRFYTMSFKEGFTSRLSSRYQEEKKAAVADYVREAEEDSADLNDFAEAGVAAESQALMVIDTAMARTKAYIDARYGKKRSARSVGVGWNSNARGRNDGASAADRISLRSNAVGGGSARASLGA